MGEKQRWVTRSQAQDIVSKILLQELTDFTPSFSSLLTKVCSMSGLIAFLMLLFLFKTLGVTLVLSGAGAGFLSLCFLSEKLLESVF